jgi:hypothetical protein
MELVADPNISLDLLSRSVLLYRVQWTYTGTCTDCMLWDYKTHFTEKLQ